MKKLALIISMLSGLLCASAAKYLPQNGEQYALNPDGSVQIYGGGADSQGNVAVHMDDARIKSWASGYRDYVVGTLGNPVFDKWKTPDAALGKADGDSYGIVCLGDGGSITLTFDNPITNGSGYDFAVFENAAVETFLELAFVEVSTDGVNFVRFPNFYLGEIAMGPFDNWNSPELIYNLASKYIQGYGHGFDLQELVFAYEYAQSDSCLVANGGSFSEEYRAHLLEFMPLLDTECINYVRICDIVGDGREVDSSGHVIYDPSGCFESPGFDLDAVGVINSLVPEPAECAAVFGLSILVFAFAKRRKNRFIYGS